MDLPDSAMLPREALGVIRAFDETFIQLTNSGHIGVLALEEWLLQVAIPEHSADFRGMPERAFTGMLAAEWREVTLCAAGLLPYALRAHGEGGVVKMEYLALYFKPGLTPCLTRQ